MMTTIREHAEQYLGMRRALGFKLTTFGNRLLSFVRYLEAHHMNVITAESALEWAITAPAEVTRNRRLMVVRTFARHLVVLEPATEIPPVDMLSCHCPRPTPHVYTSGETTALLVAADGLLPTLRALTFRTVVSLLAVTGMRTGEACRLDMADVDFDAGVLTIRDTKFGKYRQVPIHPSTVAALRDYVRDRDRLCRTVCSPALFVSIHGARLDHTTMPRTFRKLVDTAGITVPSGQRRPHLHDFRHSFATATLLDWYRDGVDVAARMPWLSTYLGHVDPRSTYWYLTGTPELLALAAARLDGAFGGKP